MCWIKLLRQFAKEVWVTPALYVGRGPAPTAPAEAARMELHRAPQTMVWGAVMLCAGWGSLSFLQQFPIVQQDGRALPSIAWTMSILRCLLSISLPAGEPAHPAHSEADPGLQLPLLELKNPSWHCCTLQLQPQMCCYFGTSLYFSPRFKSFLQNPTFHY